MIYYQPQLTGIPKAVKPASFPPYLLSVFAWQTQYLAELGKMIVFQVATQMDSK